MAVDQEPKTTRNPLIEVQTEIRDIDGDNLPSTMRTPGWPFPPTPSSEAIKNAILKWEKRAQEQLMEEVTQDLK